MTASYAGLKLIALGGLGHQACLQCTCLQNDKAESMGALQHDIHCMWAAQHWCKGPCARRCHDETMLARQRTKDAAFARGVLLITALSLGLTLSCRRTVSSHNTTQLPMQASLI